jgi:hypothetical protein
MGRLKEEYQKFFGRLEEGVPADGHGRRPKNFSLRVLDPAHATQRRSAHKVGRGYGVEEVSNLRAADAASGLERLIPI